VTLSHDLLEKARAAQTELAEAERRVLLARAEYHTAIRRLHLAVGLSGKSPGRSRSAINAFSRS